MSKAPIEHFLQTHNAAVVLAVRIFCSPIVSNPIHIPVDVPEVDEGMGCRVYLG